MAYAEEVGFGEIIGRGRAAAGDLRADIVYAGLSLGVLPAQMLAQTGRARGARCSSMPCIPLAEFGGSWPAGVPLQIHTMEGDELGDVEVAREVAATVSEAELFLYPGDRHLFTDRSLPAYDERAAALLLDRVREFLG
jgi:dienelactone hydrolase